MAFETLLNYDQHVSAKLRAYKGAVDVEPLGKRKQTGKEETL